MSRDRPPEVNSGYDRYKGGRVNDLVSVTLECDHPIKLRTIPMHDNARFPCTNNTGCGYRLRWRKWVDRNGIERFNRTLRKEEESGGEPDVQR